MDRASGSAARPQTTALVMPNSPANAAICEVTISPDVDISVIITNISQNTGERSISAVEVPGASRIATADTGAGFSPSAATRPTSAKIAPYCSSVIW